MTLLTPNPVGRNEGGGVLLEGFAVLDHELYRDMRWCPNCAGEQLFIEVYEIAQGRVGFCFGCGEEKIVGFSRVNGEAA